MEKRGGGGGVTLFCPYFSAFLKKRGHFLTQKEKSQWNRVLNASKFQGSFYYAHQTQYTTDKSRRGTKVEGVRLKHLNGFTMFLTHNNSHNKDCKVGTLLILPGYVIISLSFFFLGFRKLSPALACESTHLKCTLLLSQVETTWLSSQRRGLTSWTSWRDMKDIRSLFECLFKRWENVLFELRSEMAIWEGKWGLLVPLSGPHIIIRALKFSNWTT